MAQFKYTALARDGTKVSGVMDGFNELDAVGRIRETCDVILRIREIDTKKSSFWSMDVGGRRLNAKAFTMMCNQFGIILNAGIPIARAVKLVADKTADKTLKKVMDRVAQDVDGGRSLSAAFADYGEKLLPVTFIETLRAGEATGNLANAFVTMAEHFDKQTKLRAKVRGAMAYPMFVLVIAVVVVIVLMVKVMPVFTNMFAELGGELPLPTKILIGTSEFFRKYILFIAIGAAALFLLYKVYVSSESGRVSVARLRLKLPVLGRIEELNAASQFSNTMRAMLGAGLTMDRAVAITAKVVSNAYLSRQTEKLTAELEAGRQLGTAMREHTRYPDILIDMASVGEGSGEMEKTMGTIAAYYDAELMEATQSALSKLEPALLVAMAGVAGFIVIAIYLAMFSMYGAMGSL